MFPRSIQWARYDDCIPTESASELNVFQVPAIAYGGPKVSPDQPSPESTKLVESLVLVELFADLFPESGILPKDPILRAKARLFVDAVSTKLGPAQVAVIINGGDPEILVQAYEHLQALLPPQGFAVGEFSIADIAIAPFLARIELNLANDLGGFPEGKGEGPKILELLRAPKLARIQEYAKALQAHPSVASTFDKVSFVDADRRSDIIITEYILGPRSHFVQEAICRT